MKRPIILEGEPFDWEAGEEAILHAIGPNGPNWANLMAADPGVILCPNCHEALWCEGTLIECPDCHHRWRISRNLQLGKKETHMIDITGLKVKEVRQLTAKELTALGWDDWNATAPMVIILEDDSMLVAADILDRSTPARFVFLDESTHIKDYLMISKHVIEATKRKRETAHIEKCTCSTHQRLTVGCICGYEAQFMGNEGGDA